MPKYRKKKEKKVPKKSNHKHDYQPIRIDYKFTSYRENFFGIVYTSKCSICSKEKMSRLEYFNQKQFNYLVDCISEANPVS